MPYEVVEFQATPNPNAVKCVLDKPPAGLAAPAPQRSYTDASAAADDPLGAALMAIPGVRNVLIHDEWISIGKLPESDWKTVKAAVKRVLHGAA